MDKVFDFNNMPFLVITRCGYGPKVSVVLFFLYLLLLLLFCITGKSLHVQRKEAVCGQIRREVFVSLILFVLAPALLHIITSMASVSSQTEGDVLQKIADTLLRTEMVLSVFFLVFVACMIILTPNNRSQFLNTINRIIRVLLLAYLYASIYTRQIELFSCNNWIMVLLLGMIYTFMGFYRFRDKDVHHPRSNKSEEPIDTTEFSAIEQYEDLFEERKHAADQLINIIKAQRTDACSICINGRWGDGKTSVVNAALNELRRNEAEKYEVICVNASEIDTLQALMDYIMGQIRKCLKKRGTYVGVGSEYKGVVTELAKTMGSSSFADWIDETVFAEENDFRSKQKRLGAIIQNAMGLDGKIIITIDDIERCSDEKARQFVLFARSIASMPNCVLIFVTDYDYLERQFKSENNQGKHQFFDKYFDYRIDLTPISAQRALYELCREKCILKSELQYESYLNLDKEYENIIFLLNSRKKKLDEQNSKNKNDQIESAINRIDEVLNEFKRLLDNPRRVVKMVSMATSLYKNINSAGEPDKDIEKIRKHFDFVKLHRIIFFLSFLHVCYPAEEQSLMKNGTYVFLKSCYQKMDEASSAESVIFTLSEGLFVEEVNPILARVIQYSVSENYTEKKTAQFAEILLKNPANWQDDVNAYKSQEEEWLDAVDQEKQDVIKKSWNEIMKTVLSCSYSYKLEEYAANREIGNQRVQKLLTFAANEIRGEKENPNRFAAIFDERENHRWWDSELMIMQDVLDIWGQEGVIDRLPSNVSTCFAHSSPYFVHQQINHITRIAIILSDNQADLSILKDAWESVFFGDDKASVSNRINRYIEKIGNISNFPVEIQAEDDAFKRLDMIIAEVGKIVANQGVGECEDIKLSIKTAKDAVNNMRCYEEFQNRLSSTQTEALKADGSCWRNGREEETVARLEALVKKADYTAYEAQVVSDLFNQIATENIHLSKEQLVRLHAVASELNKNHFSLSMQYHSILFNYALQREKKKQAEKIMQ